MSKLQRLIRRPAAERGFTLIELLVVIIILGILAAVVVFAVNGVGDKGKSAALTIDDRTIRTAQEAYCAKNGTYASGQELVDGGFLSELPEYHQVNAQPNQGGPCNGWKYFILRTAQADPYPAGHFDLIAPFTLGFTQSLIRLSDGRVVANGYNSTFDAPQAEVWDPVTNTWSPGETPLFGSQDPTASAILLEDNPATPQNECKGALDNCGKYFVRGRFLFDPRKAVGTGQWETVPSAGPGCNICFNGGSNANYVKLGGTQCGANCGKIAIISFAGAFDTGTGDLYDPKDNSYTPIVFPDSATRDHASSPSVLLPDGRIFVCCGSSTTFRASFLDPATLTWNASPSSLPPVGSNYRRGNDPQPIPVLPDGSILFGNDSTSPRSAGIYTPQANGPGTWKIVASCNPAPGTAQPINCQIMGPLPDGRVLGLRSSSVQVASTTHQIWVYNPATEKWTQNPTRLVNSLPSPGKNSWGGAFLTLDPAGGPCGAYCGKMMIAGFAGSAEVYTP